MCVRESEIKQHTDLFCVNGLAKFSRNGTYGEGGSVAAGGWNGNNVHLTMQLSIINTGTSYQVIFNEYNIPRLSVTNSTYCFGHQYIHQSDGVTM